MIQSVLRHCAIR